MTLLCSSSLLFSKPLTLEYEYKIVGEKENICEQIALSDLFCNCVIYKAYKKSGRKLSFLDQNIGSFPIDKLEISTDSLASIFQVKIDSEYMESILPNFYESLFSIGSKGISHKDFYRVKMIMMETYYSQIDGKEVTNDASEIMNSLTEIDYNSFSNYLRNDQLAHRMKRVNSKAKKTLAVAMENRGFTFASPVVDFAVGQHANESSIIHVGGGFQMNIPEDKRNDITYIITQMGTKKRRELTWSGIKLWAKGRNIANVPTLQFLGYIFSNPTLKSYMQRMRGNKWKWDEHMFPGIQKGLQSQYNSGALPAQLEGFARYVGVDYQALKTQMDHQNWTEFVAILLR